MIRIDLLSDLGRTIAGVYGVRAVPTTLVVNGAGQVALHTAGIPNAGQLHDAVLALAGEK